MTEIKTKLFTEFPKVSTKEWEEKIKIDLKGQDYNKKLIWKTHENFDVKPYYRTEDLKGLEYLKNNPTEFPYNRGNNLGNNWKINFNINVSDIDKANNKAIELIKQGVNSVCFILENKITEQDFNNLLKNIDAEIIFYSKSLDLYESISDILKGKENISNLFSPISNFISKGKMKYISNEAFDLIAKNITENHNKVINVIGANYKNAGSSTSQEIAYTILEAIEYMDILTEREINSEKIVEKMQFTMGVSSDYFMEIAKIRATRYIWSKICKEYNIEESKANIYINSENSDWNKTTYDPYVNMLRATTEAMSAIIGGTDSLYIKGFDSIVNNDNSFADRIAVNTQNILREEAYFDKITDPASGSYYIENLTNNLIEKAWEIILKTNDGGGLLCIFREGKIQESINKVAENKNKNLAIKKEILLGTNQYANINEEVNTKIIEEKTEDFDIKPINIYRGAEIFENIRNKTATLNKIPKVFLFTYGNRAMRKARAMFASNFFACAGFETIDNAGFENINDGIAKFNSTKSDLLVLCSADDEYLNLATEISKSIESNKLVIAGYPKNIIDDLSKLGVENFVHVKSNLIEELTKYQTQLSNKNV